MTELNQSYEDGIEAEKARIIDLILNFQVADMESLDRPGILIKFPLEDLVALINGE
jgi:hypothetical protein